MKIYKGNRAFIWCLLIALFFQLVYLSIASSNVPLMDYWHYINMFVEKMNTGGLTFLDIWQNDGIHRSPLQFIYFLINVRMFHLNSQVEIYLGAILMALTATLLYRQIKKDLATNKIWIKGVAGGAIIIAVYNLNQYELINEQFALSFASRMILFLMSFLLTNSYLMDIKEKRNYTLELGMLYIIVIESVGGGYFPAYVVSLSFIFILHYFLKRKNDKNVYLKEYIFLLACLVIGTGIYLQGILGQGAVTVSGNVSVIDFLKDFFTGVIFMLGVSIFGFEHTSIVTFFTGCCIFCIYLCSFILYFRKRYYEKTYIPVLFMGYSVGAMGLIYLGRMGKYGIDYAFSSRYVCETNVALLGFIWIVAIYISDFFKNETTSKKKVMKCSAVAVSMIVLLIGVVSSDYKEWEMAPYRKIYGENLIQSMKNVELLTAEEFTPFQSTEEYVRCGIDIMKKYDLGIFYYNKE